MPVKKRLEYAIQATASVWMPFEQVHGVESGDVILSGWYPGTPAGCTAMVASSVRHFRL